VFMLFFRSLLQSERGLNLVRILPAPFGELSCYLCLPMDYYCVVIMWFDKWFPVVFRGLEHNQWNLDPDSDCKRAPNDNLSFRLLTHLGRLAKRPKI